MRKLPGKWATLAAAAACCAISAVAVARAAAHTPAPAVPAVDIELAFDTTGSMEPSITRARQDALTIVRQVKSTVADTRLAVVSFRDYGNPGGVYQVLQGFTADEAAIQAAIERLEIRRNNDSPFNTAAEEYNLAFQRSYTDSALDWRADARKIVVVIGDAEPHSAGRSGFAGCRDATVDHYGLETRAVLQGMRDARRTLIMVRQISPATTASLRCYESLAAASYTGGAARDSGQSLVEPIVALIRQAFTSLTVRSDVAFSRPRTQNGVTVRIKNPNPFPLTLTDATVDLPAGAAYRPGTTTGGTVSDPAVSGRSLVWAPGVKLAAEQTFALHVFYSAPRTLGAAPVAAAATLVTDDGLVFHEPGGKAPVRVGTRPRLLGFAFAASEPRRAETFSGWTNARGSASWRSGKLHAGRFVLETADGGSLTLAPRSYTVTRAAAPASVAVDAVITRARRLPCRKGAHAVVTLTDSNALLPSGLSSDRLSLRLAGCSPSPRAWANPRTASSAGTSAATKTSTTIDLR